MPKYLFQGSYAPDGVKGLIKSGASARVAVATKLVESLGGKMESFYFCFGSDDFVAIADLPDNAAAVGLSATVGASGAVRGRITPLITKEEADQGFKRKAVYKAPGK